MSQRLSLSCRLLVALASSIPLSRAASTARAASSVRLVVSAASTHDGSRGAFVTAYQPCESGNGPFGIGSRQGRKIGQIKVREMHLTANGLTAAQCAEAQPTLQRAAYMSDMRVDPAIRNKPIRINGRRVSLAVELMRACEEIARSWSYDETYLNVYETNALAARLYVDKLDYEVLTTRPPRRKHAPTSLCMRKRHEEAGRVRTVPPLEEERRITWDAAQRARSLLAGVTMSAAEGASGTTVIGEGSREMNGTGSGPLGAQN